MYHFRHRLIVFMKILAVIIIIFAPGKKDDQVVKGSITVSPDTFSSSATDQVLRITKCALFSNILYFLLTLLLPLLKKRAASLLLLWFFSCNSLPDNVTWQQRWSWSWSTRPWKGKWNWNLKYLKVELLCRHQPLCDLFQITLFFSKWKSAHNFPNLKGDWQNWKPGQDWLCCPPPREGCCAQLLPSAKNI